MVGSISCAKYSGITILIKAIIGAGYGDEGKGNTVNKLCNESSLIVRFNGGAQAGHTVIHNGIRHVFSSFGSGTLRGAPTHLSRFFVCHPLEFLSELYSLRSNGILPHITVSPECYLTTPYDVILNAIIEEYRGVNRHGSVGLGFGETIERCENHYITQVKSINYPKFKKRLKRIRDEWVPFRLNRFGLSLDQFPHYHKIIYGEHLLNNFVEDCQTFLKYIELCQDETRMCLDMVFEGAQGLMLDAKCCNFPYVTRSRTGLTNVLTLTNGKIDEVYYVTRSYTTRHGAGPLPHELGNIPYFGVKDDTNITNKFQGQLRFSYLNFDTIQFAIQKDLKQLLLGYKSNGKVFGVMTCLDQLPPKCKYIENNTIRTVSTEFLPQIFAEKIQYRCLTLNE